MTTNHTPNLGRIRKIHVRKINHSQQQWRRIVLATPTSHMTGHWVCQCVRREKMTTGRLARKLALLATPTKVRLHHHTCF
ncbi:hypothetical protein GBAR_LOCUS30418, partial [Geodia barretti]